MLLRKKRPLGQDQGALCHLNSRLVRCHRLCSKEQAANLRPLLAQLKSCIAAFRTAGEGSVFNATSAPSMSAKNTTSKSKSTASHESRKSSDESEGNGGSDSSEASERESRKEKERRKKRNSRRRNSQFAKPPDFHKWGVTFSGAPDKSVISFIVELEEKADWKGINRNLLVQGAPEFFSGRAKTWFRSIRSEIDSWEELKIALRTEFLPLDYFSNPWDEIKDRKQGRKESVGEHVSNMIALFERFEMSQTITDETKLNILKNNLAPYYLSRLALTQICSIPQLKQLGKSLEVSKAQMDKYEGKEKPKPMEPEFALKVQNTRKPMQKVETFESAPSKTPGSKPENNSSGTPTRKMSCWNCKKEGHTFVKCLESKKRTFCYGCGRDGVTSKDCPKCKINKRRTEEEEAKQGE